MKYKTFLLLLLAFAIPTPSMAEIVSLEEALRVATDFFNSSKEIQTLGSMRTLKEIWDSSRLSQGGVNLFSSEAPTFYVFAPESGKGFVIVSAEDAMPPILGYSFEDEAPTGELPCNIRFWFEAMHDKINRIRSEGKVATMEVKQKWAKTSAMKEVFIMQTAKWSQDEPYNLQCPMYGGSLCVTGCVQTAMAIVMKYHEWPEMGYGETEAYTTSSYGIQVDARSLEHEYDWSNMLLKYNGGEYSDEEAHAVSILMADLGFLFKADYGVSATSAGPDAMIENNFDKHFDYSSAMYFASKSYYSDDEWLSLLKTEIRRNGPTYYTGRNSAFVGHAFVFDGYTDDDYFHVNWGWGTTGGFFMLPDIYYPSIQMALFNLKPNIIGETITTLYEDAEEMLDAMWRNITTSCADVASSYCDLYESLSAELENLRQDAEGADRLAEEQKEEIKQEIKEVINSTREMQKSAQQAENEYLYDEITIEISDVNDKLNDAWNTITTYYADVADEFKDTYNVILSELDELSQNAKNAYNAIQLSKEMVEYIDDLLETIRQEIENLLLVSKISETNYLYETLNAEIKETKLLLDEVWYIVTTNYAVVANGYEDEYDILTKELNQILYEVEGAYDNDTLTKELAEEIRTKLEAIRQEIEAMLVVAKEAHEGQTGIYNINTYPLEVEGIYSTSGQKITTPQKGINIVLYSDGSTRKILVQ